MASLDDPGEVREGFLCPLCLKDLQSFYQLQSHYEEEHSSEDRDVKGQIKSLVQRAKKAKNKLLKREDDRSESGTQGYESFSYGGVDPYMWEPQELGAVRSHLSDFKKHRAARIDHYVVEVNKLIIRLEKLTAFDRTNTESAKVRAIEKSVVPWVNDQDVPFCPDCGNKFSIRNRRHHCRLCGSIMCKKCMELISLPLASKLTSASKEASLASHSSPNQSPNSIHGSRRGSISSVSSVSSVLDEKDDERIRCCGHCKEALLKREQQIDEKEHTPDIVKLYENGQKHWKQLLSKKSEGISFSMMLNKRVYHLTHLCLTQGQKFSSLLFSSLVESLDKEMKLRICMEKVDQKAPEYIKMAASLNAGETTYSLEHANDLRVEVQKVYELIDALSKKILTLGLNQEPQPHPRALQLQRMIRYSATLFVQEKLLGLMSLPTKEQYEELKKKRKQEIERKLIMERQAALELQRKSEERQKELVSRGAVNGEETFIHKGAVRKAEGWLPMSSGPGHSEESDPLLQQIHNITSFIKQAKAASRIDEVRMLQENLRQLQDEYDQQQTEKAIELSRKQAEEEDLQREQLQVLREKEWEREQSQVLSHHSRTHSLDFKDKVFQQESGMEPQNQIAHVLDLGSSLVRSKVALSPSPNSVQEPNKEKSVFPVLDQEIVKQNTGVYQNEAASLNPFEEEEISSPGNEDFTNPFAEDGGSSLHSTVPSVKKEYNPFEDEEDEPPGDADGPILNPFEVDDLPYQKHSSPPNPGNPFEEPASTNPFDIDDSETEREELIEEELLLQQIDNIKAYIFDAKQCGRLDEVEVLTENLKELKRALVKQKEKLN